MPDVFQPAGSLENWFQTADASQQPLEPDVIKNMKLLLEPFILRRTKREVLPGMVPNQEVVIRCSFSGAQEAMCRAISVCFVSETRSY